MAVATETDKLLKDAALIVDVCFSVEEGDVVTIICDDERADEARAVADVCVERGAWPVVMNNETQVRRGRADVRFPMAPPANLHRAMVGSDEVIILTNLEWANRFAHVNAVRETCEANGKIASIEPGMGEWGLTTEDLERSAQRTRDAVAALAGKKHVRVTTDLGTDFTVSIEGRPPLELTPYKARGQMMSPIPLWTEVAFAAIEDFTHGTAAVDGVMLGIGLEGQVEEPIRWTLEGGRCV
jgi:leucyl aminopeptidase (aminopeptidase T)